ncbi:SIR2 family protein [Shinella kummerowiae]|uniref:SIR2 family protein n=1 Tax=Shinella kummerowiae TaxID=417745 RepID=A0A6N8S7K1_9HYPH|nr:SIR2 family protein [Shinella kummerowiae]MXN44641.1 SIR2 family protein [Shinella kummerowiae]
MLEDDVAKIAQSCFASSPVVVLGSGASASHGLPGMGALKDFLLEKVTTDGDEEAEGWAKVTEAFAAGEHLEQALTGKALPALLTRKIVGHTWECINNSDKVLFSRAVRAEENFPLGRLILALLASSQKVLDIVTTNYDRVAEYACNSVDVIHSVGFTPGYLQRREGSYPISFVQAGKSLRTVKIWKVHGSLDWFERSDGTALSAPLYELPEAGLLPLIVTPGFNKYERTHDEPFRSAIQGADRALEQSDGYLCLGFGFRDAHIEPKILERCRLKKVPVTVVARTLTDEAKTFLQQKAGPLFLGIEQSAKGSRAYFHAYPDGIDIPGVDYWSVDGFLNLVT